VKRKGGRGKKTALVSGQAKREKKETYGLEIEKKGCEKCFFPGKIQASEWVRRRKTP